MRLPDENKRRQIIATAADMFASLRYHEVRLDDVAEKAGVGKGTLYVYFQSKEELYFTIAFKGIALILEQLREKLAADHRGAMHRLETIVDGLVDFAFQYPQFFELVKTIGPPKDNPQWEAQRNELFGLIEQTILDGIKAGELTDAHPALTARFIPGLVRSAMMFARENLQSATLKAQICALLENGLTAEAPAKLSV